MKKKKIFFLLFLMTLCSGGYYYLKAYELPNNLALLEESASTDLGNEVFIKNDGQWDKKILFKAILDDGDLYIRKNGISFVKIEENSFGDDGHFHDKKDKLRGVRVDMNFDKANEEAVFLPMGKSKIYYNYFKKSSKSDNHAITVHSYSKVYIKNLYEGIDWRIFTTIYGELKHEFIVHPYADPDKIKLIFEGHDTIEVKNNLLSVLTPYGKIIEKPPYTYYSKGKEALPVKYKVENNMVQFDLPKKYNQKETVIIDPTLVFSTFSGSSAVNWGYTATYGEDGTAYSAGIVFGTGFPVTPGAFDTSFNGPFNAIFDIGILKYNRTGTQLLYATYLGGDDFDIPHSLLMDQNENLLIFGTTASPDFPTTASAFQQDLSQDPANFSPYRELYGPIFRHNTDIFLARLSKDGTQLLNSTFIGGVGRDGINSPLVPQPVQPAVPSSSVGRFLIATISRNYGDSFRGDLAEDQDGNIYVSSTTESTDFPLVNPYQPSFGGGTNDGVVFKMDANLENLLWSTFLGGDGGDVAYNIKFLGQDKIAVCGGTYSTSNFLPTAGSFKPTYVRTRDSNNQLSAEGFVATLAKATGQVMEATFVGTDAYDQVYFIDTDSQGDIIALGQTNGNYPRTSGAYGVVNGGLFLQKLSPDLKRGLFSTTLGTPNSNTPLEFPVVNRNVGPNLSPTAFLVNTCDDIYITGFASGGFGGSYQNPIVDTNITYAIPFRGSSTGLPTTSDAYQKTTDGRDFYLMILSKDATQLNYATFFGNPDPAEADHVDGGTNRFDKEGVVYHAVCAGCEGNSTYPTTSGAFSTQNLSPSCSNGMFKFDLLGLSAGFSTNTADGTSDGISSGCAPFAVVFNNTTLGNGNYTWDFGDGTPPVTVTDKDQIINHTFQKEGTYTVTLTATVSNTCQGFSTFSRQLVASKTTSTYAQDTKICEGESYDLFVTNATSVSWQDEQGNELSTQDRFTVSPTQTTTYVLDAAADTCPIKTTVTVEVMPNISAEFNFYETANATNKNSTAACATLPAEFTFENLSRNGTRYVWDFGDNTPNRVTALAEEVTHVFQTAGQYTVSLTAENPLSCNRTLLVTRNIGIGEILNTQLPPVAICYGDSYQLSTPYPTTTGVQWFIKDQVQPFSTVASPMVSPNTATTYIAKSTNTNGCPATSEITIDINDVYKIDVRESTAFKCSDQFLIAYEAFYGDNEEPVDTQVFSVEYDMGDGTIYNTPKVSHEYKKEGTYTIKFKAEKAGCSIEKTFEVKLPNVFIPNVITANGDKKNDTFIVETNRGKIKLKLFDRWGKQVFESDDYKNDWPAANNKQFNGVFNYETTFTNGETCKGWVEVIN